jgi:hypothetical protein
MFSAVLRVSVMLSLLRNTENFMGLNKQHFRK